MNRVSANTNCPITGSGVERGAGLFLPGLLIFCLFSISGGASAAGTEEGSFDTLFLRDGSILQGTILRDSHGRYYVSNPLYGDVAIDGEAVLYLLPKSKEDRWAVETHVAVQETLEVISTFSQAVPEPVTGGGSFSLLMPGKVESVSDRNSAVIPFQSREIPGLTIIKVEYEDIPGPDERLVITSRQSGLLQPTETGALEFRAKRVFDDRTDIRMILEHPPAWEVESISPQPVHRFEGLIVWEKSLKRQQTFLPTVRFRLEAR